MATSPPSRRRWRTWAWRLLLAAVGLRVLLALFLPQVLGLVASMFGLTVTMRSASLSLLGLSLRCEDIVVLAADQPEARPLLRAQDLVADLSLMHLLVGDLVVVDAALSGASVALQRSADGSWRLPRGWTEQPPVRAAATTSPAKSPVRFDSPVSVGSCRLHGVQLHFSDESADPPMAFDAEIDIDIRDLGRRDRPGALALRLHAPAWFDAMWLRAEVTTMSDRLEVTWDSSVRGVRPGALPWPESWREAFAGMPAVAIDWRGNVHGRVRAGAPQQPELTSVVRFAAHGAEVEGLTFTAAAGPWAGGATGDVTPFTCLLLAPGFIDRLHVADGTLQNDGNRLDLRATANVQRATLGRFGRFLAERGITLPATGLDLSASIEAELGDSISASLHDVEVRGGNETLRLRQVAIHDLRQDGDGLAVDSCDIIGPELDVATTADACLRVAGVRLRPTPPAVPPPEPPPPFVLPRLRLGSLRWTELRCTWTDERMSPAESLTLDRVQVRADGLTLGADAPPGRLTAEASIARVADALRLDCTITSVRDRVTVESQLQGSGITMQGAAPWLAKHGLAPNLRAGSLQLLGAATITATKTGPTVDGRLANVAWRDGEEVLLRVRSLDTNGIAWSEDTFDLGRWQIQEPYVAVHRASDGATSLLGLTVLPRPNPAPPVAPPVAPPIAATVALTAPPAAAPATMASHASGEPAALRHGTVVVAGAAVRVQDDRLAAPIAIGFDATLAPPALADGPTPFTVTMRVDDIVSAVHLQGTLGWHAGIHLDATLEAKGVRGAGVDRLLPPNVRCTLVDGSLRARAKLVASGEPSASLELALDEVRFEDRGENLANLDHLRLHCPVLTAAHVHVGELTANGCRALLTTTGDGLHVPGFRLLAAAPTLAPPTPASAGAPDPEPTSAWRAPDVTIDALTLTCDRFVIRDRTAGEGTPLVLRGTVTAEPWRGRANDETTTPLRLALRASATPLCGELQVDVRLDPFALAPTCHATLTGRTIDLAQLPAIWPSLHERIRPVAGPVRLTARLDGRMDLRRRDPRVFALARPFGGELLLDDIAVHDEASDVPLLTVGAVEATARAIDPRTGDALLRSLSISDVSLALARQAEGVDVLGLRLLPTPAATTGTGTAGSEGLRPEFAIDHLSLHGLRVDLTDATTQPSSKLPIADGDFELRQFSTRATAERRPFGFELSLRGGDVQLERRVLASSMLAGVLGSAIGAVGGKTDQHEMESRPWFDEFTVAGQLQLAPVLTGEVRSSIATLELPAFRALAKAAGVEISDGVFDQSLRLRLGEGDGAELTSNQVFTWLSLSEPPGGPISTWLRLPAPLDTVLFLLRNDADEHRLPIRVAIPTSGFSGPAVIGLVGEALIRIVADAVASAGFRAAGAVTGAIGLGASTFQPATAAVSFAAGDPLPAALDLEPIVAALRGDDAIEVVLVHELGAGDFARAAALATPPPATLAEEIARHRANRSALTQSRELLAAEVAAMWAAGRRPEVLPRQAELAALDRRLGALERTIDAALAMADVDSERQRLSRARVAARALGQTRLDAVRSALERSLPTASHRLVLRQPRGVLVADLPRGGRVVLATRRRTAG